MTRNSNTSSYKNLSNWKAVHWVKNRGETDDYILAIRKQFNWQETNLSHRRICIYPTPHPQSECDTRSILHGVLLVWNQGFLSWLVKNPAYNLSIVVRGIDGFMPFPMGLMQSEIQTALSRIWTQGTNPNSYDDKQENMWQRLSGRMERLLWWTRNVQLLDDDLNQNFEIIINLHLVVIVLYFLLFFFIYNVRN